MKVFSNWYLKNEIQARLTIRFDAIICSATYTLAFELQRKRDNKNSAIENALR